MTADWQEVSAGDRHRIVRADARSMPFLEDDSVDLVVTSPPYWAQRSYQDSGGHYDGQIGAEAHPLAYVEDLVDILDGEVRRVLKRSGSLWLNLGDKYSSGDAEKSLVGLPERVAIALTDAGWVRRATVIWAKKNAMPEPVRDRVRASHEYFYHFTLEPRYYSAVDRIRDVSVRGDRPLTLKTWADRKAAGEPGGANRGAATADVREAGFNVGGFAPSELGRIPGSVWEIAYDPQVFPPEAAVALGLETGGHYAVFPQELARRPILGWSPEAVCLSCGEGLAPVVDRKPMIWEPGSGAVLPGVDDREMSLLRRTTGAKSLQPSSSVVGEVCSCDVTGETVPGVVLDPFGGTGTTAGVAAALGRFGVSVDLSMDYCRMAQWRIEESGQFERQALKRLGVAKVGKGDAAAVRRLLEAAEASEWEGL